MRSCGGLHLPALTSAAFLPDAAGGGGGGMLVDNAGGVGGTFALRDDEAGGVGRGVRGEGGSGMLVAKAAVGGGGNFALREGELGGGGSRFAAGGGCGIIIFLLRCVDMSPSAGGGGGILKWRKPVFRGLLWRVCMSAWSSAGNFLSRLLRREVFFLDAGEGGTLLGEGGGGGKFIVFESGGGGMFTCRRPAFDGWFLRLLMSACSSAGSFGGGGMSKC